uniref:Uncharacterized protein n=1 Tax=Parascaris equorum TaxID=6256 RepID=A0A914R9T9_PAREQ
MLPCVDLMPSQSFLNTPFKRLKMKSAVFQMEKAI